MANKSKARTTTSTAKPGPKWDFVDLQLDGDLSNIRQDHIFDAIGLNDARRCQTKFDSKERRDIAEALPEHSNDQSQREAAPTENQAPKCTKKWCEGNLLCFNHIGAEEWVAKDALTKFLSAQDLGNDPAESQRLPGIPCGLRNLGATCYANAFLQVWFQTLPIRAGVYACVEDIASVSSSSSSTQSSPLYQLAKTFAALQNSEQKVHNPSGLVEALMLEKGNQQDASEFSKLFMSLLADEFQKQDDPRLKTLFADQFEGKFKYSTKCLTCNHDSHREESFLEMEVSLEGSECNLEDRLRYLLSPERLDGENKYFCSACNSLRNAERSTFLASVPPILHFSLLRFVYDPKTATRKKSKTAIKFPPRIDMGRWMNFGESSGNQYELRGVVEHIGNSAHHGHFVCRVFDPEKNKWFLCDDEDCKQIRTMTNLVNENFESDAAGSSGSTFSEAVATGSTASTQTVAIDSDSNKIENENPIDPITPEKGSPEVEVVDERPRRRHRKENLSTPLPIHSSSNAYMLVYERCPSKTGKITVLPQPTGSIHQSIMDANQEYKDKTMSFRQRECNLKEVFENVKSIKLDTLGPHAGETKSGYLVDKASLERWVRKGLQKQIKLKLSNPSQTLENPDEAVQDPTVSLESPGVNSTLTIGTIQPDEAGPFDRDVDMEESTRDKMIIPDGTLSPSFLKKMEPIDWPTEDKAEESMDGISIQDRTKKIVEDYVFDNTALTCCHGLLDPAKANTARLISEDTLTSLITRGCRFNPILTVADSCCRKCLDDIVGSRLHRTSRHEQIEQYRILARKSRPDDKYAISWRWISAWKSKMDDIDLFDEEFLNECRTDIFCEHGAPKRDVKRVDGSAVNYLQSEFPERNLPAVSLELFPGGCKRCQDSERARKELADSFQGIIADEKLKLADLLKRDMTRREAPKYSTSYFVISPEFVEQWKLFIKDPVGYSRPILDNSSFICEHDKLNVDPAYNPDTAADVMCIMEEPVWLNLTTLYGYPGRVITFLRTNAAEMHCSTEICRACWQARHSGKPFDIFAILLNGEEEALESIMPVEPTAEESNDWIVETTNGNNKRQYVGPTGPRKSTRVRRQAMNANGTQRKSVQLRIAGTDTLLDLKKSIEQKWGIVPYLQRVFVRGLEVDENLETLERLGIRPDDQIKVREVKAPDDEEIQCLGDSETISKPTKEVGTGGFGGTLLHGRSSPPRPTSSGVSEEEKEAVSPDLPIDMDLDDSGLTCPDCTFVNIITSSRCEMCDKTFFA